MIQIAILGFGVVGSGTAEVLTENKAIIEKKVGQPFDIKYILDLRDFPDSPFGDKVIHDFNIIVNDPEISLVAEMMGGSHPAYDFTKACLEAGKSVVTSNKEVVANFGPELLAEAKAHSLRYLFEASVGGGIPIIRAMTTSLAGNEVCEISGILNGTTNYILTEMREKGLEMETVLKTAQELGYAERDPSADIDGIDACRKICILSALGFGKLANPADVPTTGIRNVTKEDIKAASDEGCVLRLIAHAVKKEDGSVELSVAPTKLPAESPLASVNGVFNAVLVRGKSLGEVMFYGAGAGSLPTASAVLADVMDLILFAGKQPLQQQWERA